MKVLQVTRWGRRPVIFGITLFSCVACSLNRSESPAVAVNSNATLGSTHYSRLAPTSSSTDAELGGKYQLSVVIPEIELSDVLKLKVQITNNDLIPTIDGNFALTYTVEYVIAPYSSFSGDVRKLVDETAYARLIGEQDFFLKPIRQLESGAAEEIDVAKFPLKRILDDFYICEEHIPDAKPELRVWAVVLRATVIDRSANIIGKSEKTLYLTRDLNGEQTLFGYRKK